MCKQTLFISLRRKWIQGMHKVPSRVNQLLPSFWHFRRLHLLASEWVFLPRESRDVKKTFYCDLKNTFPLVSNFLQSICVIDIDDPLIIRDTSRQIPRFHSLSPPKQRAKVKIVIVSTFSIIPELFIQSEHFRSKIFSRFLHSRVDGYCLDASDEAELKMKKHFKYVHNTRVRNDSGIIDILKPL